MFHVETLSYFLQYETHHYFEDNGLKKKTKTFIRIWKIIFYWNCFYHFSSFFSLLLVRPNSEWFFLLLMENENISQLFYFYTLLHIVNHNLNLALYDGLFSRDIVIGEKTGWKTKWFGPKANNTVLQLSMTHTIWEQEPARVPTIQWTLSTLISLSTLIGQAHCTL